MEDRDGFGDGFEQVLHLIQVTLRQSQVQHQNVAFEDALGEVVILSDVGEPVVVDVGVFQVTHQPVEPFLADLLAGGAFPTAAGGGVGPNLVEIEVRVLLADPYGARRLHDFAFRWDEDPSTGMGEPLLPSFGHFALENRKFIKYLPIKIIKY